MSNPIFWRLVWKEYRMLRAFWISMAVLTVLGQLWVLKFARSVSVQDRVDALFTLALVFPAFYALGCGATLFATERENATYPFQRSLPVSARKLFFAKLGFGVISTPLMFVLLWLLAAFLAGWQLPDGALHAALWAMWGLAAVELFVWGVLFSLLLRHPLAAAILAAVAATLSVHWAASTMTPRRYLEGLQYYLDGVPLRVAIVLLVAAADVWLGLRWLREETGDSRAWPRLFRRRASKQRVGSDRILRQTRGSIVRRLTWHHARQSAPLLAALGAMVLPMAVFGVIAWIWPASWRYVHWGRPFGSAAAVFIVLGGVAAPLVGSCVFLADKQGYGFRFLAERGVRPRHVWLSRQAVWIAAALVWAALALPFFTREERGDPKALTVSGLLLGFAVVAYASGQFCSMFFKSGILAGFLGLVLTGFVCSWAGLMSFLQTSWLWSVAPIPLILLFATWLRTPHWLLERNDWRAWLRAGASVLVPVGALLVAVCAYRVYQIPLVDPGFSPQQFARPATAEERATLQLYRQAAAVHVPISEFMRESETPAEETLAYPDPALADWEVEWLEANEDSLKLAIEASGRPACDFFDPLGSDGTLQDVRELGRLLVASARKLQDEGRLDEALERYLATLRVSRHARHRSRVPFTANAIEHTAYQYLPSWATHPGQTPERIEKAVRQLEKLTRDLPSVADGVKSEYVLQRRLIEADPDALASLGVTEDELFHLALWSKCLPWERARAVRVLDLFTAHALSAIGHAESTAARGGSVPAATAAYRSVNPFYQSDTWFRVVVATPLLYRCYWHGADNLIQGVTRLETQRRGTRLLLALEAWKLEHGRLPTTLDDLTGRYLDEVPVDPCSGKPFGYVAEGLPVSLTWSVFYSGVHRQLESGTPLFWSEGEGGMVLGPDGQRYSLRQIADGKLGPPVPEVQYKAWRSGWLFPVP